MLKYRLEKGQKFYVVSNLRIQASVFKTLKLVDETVSFTIPCEVTEKVKDVCTLDCSFANVKSDNSMSVLSKFFSIASGDRFSVRKDMRGEIYEVRGGKRIEKILFGFTLKNILMWFGAILSPKGMDKNFWTFDDGRFIYGFRKSPAKKYKGKKFPRISIKCDIKDPPFFMKNFLCNGEVLFDTKTGKIAVSTKNLKLKLFNLVDVRVTADAGEKDFI